MNPGGSAINSIAAFEPIPQEKRQAVDTNQHYTPSYYVPPGSASASWTSDRGSNYNTHNGVISSASYDHNQRAEVTSGNVQDGLSVTSTSITSSSAVTNVTQDYNNYPTYTTTDPYGYNTAGYSGYYNGYQQQANQQYSQPTTAYQNTGVSYQPPSYQNTGSYAAAGPTFSSTYYNHADYQTSGGYPSSGGFPNAVYNNQYGQYTQYPSHQYPNSNSSQLYHSADSAAGYCSTTAASSSESQPQYQQWGGYYNQAHTEVSCAPGTENLSVSNTSSLTCPVPSVSGGYPASSCPPPAPYAPPWKPSYDTSDLSAVQPSTTTDSAHDSYWKHWAPAFQNEHSNSMQAHVPTLPVSAPTYESFQNKQAFTSAQGPSAQYHTSNQTTPSNPNHQSTLQTFQQTVPQTISPEDAHRVSKLQIPTNPRIASNLAFSLPKTDKDSSTTTAATKPAYVGVSLPKQNEKASSQATDSVLKPTVFPKSLRGYVERALARCKDDAQMTACQDIMKEIITKATADGTLYTTDWDTEPLFALPLIDGVTKEDTFCSIPTSSSSKSKRSPNRRSKSRWEPVPEEKPDDKQAPLTHQTVKYGNWNKQYVSGKSESKVNSSTHMKFSLSEQKSPSLYPFRSVKRQRMGDSTSATENGEESSDSDKEQNLTAYYSAAITLADSPEERKRRENRSKRFEKTNGNKAETNNFRMKAVGAGNVYSRLASASVPGRVFEESGSVAVEDIDWDALTVRGTCQQIEKRYLRLTSAPDPATVRSEEVLEKALLMVQNSPKNYLYRCDQLKSIRQDLTVQRIRNELTVRVYETHARLAIEAGDLAEYNQCQSQLKTLYAEGINGCHMELAAYDLLCALLHSHNKRDLLSAMSRVSVEARENAAVKHAISVRTAVTSGNYVLFFKLYRTAPNLNSCLMDLYVDKMRYAAVRCMSRSYRPTVPISYIAQVLGFTSVGPTTEGSDEDTDGMEDCVEWMKAHGACLTSEDSGEIQFDTKASIPSLYIPEPEDAVSHGDASLAVSDFLTRSLGV
ncbi:unnamed protein product [Cuscuta europaea]|uniref:PCI domain-containing protein n=1 Tax=Cuscuta europaea TaxID=41803 RepID=A0A9P0YKT2_CUSEU|nr:unnamed protein product [Cuscuta europaea]